MKTKAQNVRISFLIAFLILNAILQLNSQVITRVLSPRDSIENYIQWFYPKYDIPQIITPNVDVQSTLANDERMGREFQRVGIKQDLSVNKNDGKLIQFGNHAIWELNILSNGAKSMSLKFDNTNLPENAIMYMYNKDSRFVVGPVLSKNFRSGDFRSDYITGDQINITIFIPNYKEENFKLSISSFDYGIINFYSFDDDFNDSEPCNVNTSCSEGSELDCQVNSVCKIIHSYIGSCTGSLVNNDCCDLTPYILTANHCIEGYPVDDYIFRFNYQSPQCSPNEEPLESQWIVYYGSEIKAHWDHFGSDFGLLELFDNVAEEMSFAGWNRVLSPPTNEVTAIHHPSGDVKKIAVNSDGISIQGNYWLIEQFDVGLVEPGSSGCPLFDNNGLVIGTLSTGDRNIGCEDGHGLVDNNLFGRFNVSWSGAGTNSTRLSNWLGSSTNPNSLECLELENTFISGPAILCNDGQYTLNNNLPCPKNITWSVTPIYLFDSPTSGSGSNALLSAASLYSGQAIVKFTLNSNGCNPTIIEKIIWVGKAAMPDIQIIIDPCVNIVKLFDANFNVHANTSYSILLSVNCDGIVELYQVTGLPKTLHLPFGRGCEICIEAVTVSNECGIYFDDTPDCYTVPYCELHSPINISNVEEKISQNGFKVQAYPNPTNSIVNIVFSNSGHKEVRVLDISGRIVFKSNCEQSQMKVDLSQFNSGIYLIVIRDDNGTHYEKLIKS